MVPEPNEKEMYPYVDSIIENGYANAIALYFDVYLDSEKQIVLTTSQQIHQRVGVCHTNI